jgi:pimeloyl-ACP methyl ester carboxylesterase
MIRRRRLRHSRLSCNVACCTQAQCPYDEDVIFRKVLRLLLWWLILAIVILLAVQVTLQLICAGIDRRKFPAPGKLVNIPGAEMHVCSLGQGCPHVVLESGIAASSINWGPLQAELATRTTVSTYDRAGFGWSVSSNRNCTLSRIADDLHAMLAAMQVPVPYVLVGHSFAGYITRAYANRYPEELAGLVLVDPLTPEEWIEPTSAQRWNLRGGIWFSRAGGVLASLGVVRFCLWLLQRGNSTTPKSVLALFGPKATETVGRILRELLKLPPESVRVIRARWSTPTFFWTMAEYLKALPACATELGGRSFPARIPVTVLSGGHQPQVRLDEHAAIAAHSIRGRHIIADKSRHWIHLDQPELVVEAVREMITATQAAPVSRD